MELYNFVISDFESSDFHCSTLICLTEVKTYQTLNWWKTKTNKLQNWKSISCQYSGSSYLLRLYNLYWFEVNVKQKAKYIFKIQKYVNKQRKKPFHRNEGYWNPSKMNLQVNVIVFHVDQMLILLCYCLGYCYSFWKIKKSLGCQWLLI